MNKSITKKREYIAIALESRVINAWYGDYVISKGSEKVLTKAQADKAKISGVAYFPACTTDIYTGYFKVPCKVIKRTTITTIEVVEEDY